MADIRKIHWSFWLIGTLMLIWNGLGCVNFIVQMNPEFVSSYRGIEQAIIQGRPLWATIGFAVAVFGGAAGCILLLLKKPLALYLFIASLLGVVITMSHALGAGINFGAGELIGIVFIPIAVAIFLIWYTRYSNSKGWLSA